MVLAQSCDATPKHFLLWHMEALINIETPIKIVAELIYH